MPRHALLPLSLLALFLSSPAFASKGDKVIAMMDKALTRADDQHFVYKLVTQEPGKKPRVIEMDVRIKGTEKRRTDFLAPGDVKGMKALVLSQKKMYIFLPAYRKVRRMASHVEKQSFMGTTFSQNEFASATYGGLYAGKLIKETDTHWTVRGTPREGADAAYPKLEFDIRKDFHHPSTIRYFNKLGVKVKTEQRTGYTCKPVKGGQVCNFSESKMTSHVRNGTWTKFIRKEWEVNTGVKDTYFTVRAIQRGR